MVNRLRPQLLRNNQKAAQGIQAPPPDTAVEIGIEGAEAQGLRQEITTRITLMNAVVGLELTALGTGLTVTSKPSYVLAVLGAASSFLWLLWMDQSLYTYKIAAYLSVYLAPRLSRLAAHPVLGWETFLRDVESNGDRSHRALYPRSVGQRKCLVHSGRHAEWYSALLFAVAPPLLLSLYVTDAKDSLLRVLLTSLAAGLLWVYTIIRWALTRHDIHVINDAISAARLNG